MNSGHPTRFITRFSMVSALSIASLLGGCNVFSPFDNPTSDAQLISAARAALDRGDLAEAQDLYQKVSDNDKDIRNSESAFAAMTQEGASMAALIEFVGNGANGKALTHFAERLTSGAGEAKRLAIHTAYLKHTEISDPSLKAFVKFTSSLALAAEILAETAGTDGVLSKADLVTNPATCNSGTPTSACDKPASSVLSDTAGADIATTAPSGAHPNIDQLYYAIQTAYNSLQDLQASGKFGDTSGNFSTVLNLLGNNKPSGSALLAETFRASLVETSGLNLGE